MKRFLTGFLCGAIIFTYIGVWAYDIMPNPYKIFVNGQEKQIEGYNIDGYSYFKLRDIGDVTGFNVGFVDETILIDTGKEDNMANTEVGQSLYVLAEKTSSKSSDGLDVYDVGGVMTVSYGDVYEIKIEQEGLWPPYALRKNLFANVDDEANPFLAVYDGADIILDKITTKTDHSTGSLYIPLDYYEGTLRGFLEGLE